MRINSIKLASNIAGKRILLRLDLNVPIKNNKVQDNFKIIALLPTINYLIKRQAKIIIITHLGRPEIDKDKNKFSTKPIAKEMAELLNQKIKYVPTVVGLEAGSAVSRLKNGQIILLENVRFEKGEIKNSKIFAKKLAQLADIYVNDAFAVSHRAHASLSVIKNYLPSYAGLLLKKEIVNLEKIKNPKLPFVLILGGAKIKTKLPIINALGKKAQRILLGGVLANNFFLAHGNNIGKSLCDEKGVKEAKKIISKNINKKILLPIDFITTQKKQKWQPKLKNLGQITDNDYIFDIGPQTIKLYAKHIKQATTLVWNGPMGMFEDKHFRQGTVFIARLIASRSKGSAFGIVGGGETVEALSLIKMSEYIDWISTGGGAMLAYLGDKKMPGLEGVIN